MNQNIVMLLWEGTDSGSSPIMQKVRHLQHAELRVCRVCRKLIPRCRKMGQRLLNCAGGFASGRLIAQKIGVLGIKGSDGEGRRVPRLRSWNVLQVCCVWSAYLQLTRREGRGGKVRRGPTLGDFLARKQVIGIDVCRGGWDMSGIGEDKVFGLFRVVSDVIHLIQNGRNVPLLRSR
jgi:hypothetical protein